MSGLQRKKFIVTFNSKPGSPPARRAFLMSFPHTPHRATFAFMKTALILFCAVGIAYILYRIIAGILRNQ